MVHRLQDAGNLSEGNKERLKVLSDSTANDIKSCANTCDTYSRKKLVVKFVKGIMWEARLASFSGTFAKRRDEFEFELAVHTAVVGDATYAKLHNMELRERVIEEK